VHVLIRAQSIAKGHRDRREAARLAALWVANRLTIVEPTVASATRVFGVSQPLINEELAELRASSANKTARDAIWDALDAVTAA